MLKLLLVVILVAVAIYLVTRALQQRSGRPEPGRRRPAPPRVVGPDDDPDFLRDLDRRRKHPERPEEPDA